jgi:hypothetical protein
MIDHEVSGWPSFFTSLSQSDHAVCEMVVPIAEVIYLSNYLSGISNFFIDEHKS